MSEKDYSTIRKIVLTSMIIIPLIPFMLILIISFSSFKGAVEKTTVAHLKRIVEDHRLMIELFLRERQRDLEFVAALSSFEKLSDQSELSRIFNLLQKESGAFVDLGVFDVNGLHVAYHGPFQLLGKNYRHTEWFEAVMKQGVFISDVFLGYREIPHFIIAVVRGDASNRWILRATVDSQTFYTLVRGVRIGSTGEAFILNRAGVFQTQAEEAGNVLQQSSDVFFRSKPTHEVQTFISNGQTGTPYLNATVWLKDQSWLLVVRQAKSEAFGSLRTAIALAVLILVVGGMAILFSAMYMTQRIVQRLTRSDAEKDQMHQQLIGAGRLAELGEMAAGFAHEINNPLQLIQNEQALAAMLLEELPQNGPPTTDIIDEVKSSLGQIQLQVSRCSQITQSILKFGRQSEPQVKPIDLQRFIPEIIAMLATKAEINGVRLEQHVSPAIDCVRADPSQLQQVVLNLCNNAFDAIASRHGLSGGHLRISADYEASRSSVVLSIADNGCGIGPDNLKKIFSPFFSTKPVGRGTGLGLSICYGIVADMGGEIKVDSTLNIGTTFQVALPSAPRTARDRSAISAGPGPVHVRQDINGLTKGENDGDNQTDAG